MLVTASTHFSPSTAINQLEMWQGDTFDPETIDRELGWAASLGMNTVRVFLHDVPWRDDAEGFFKRVDQFLEICAKHKIRPMIVLFDGVWDPARLLQVLTNLVSNALKFSPRGGTVRISARGNADWVEISVSDEGIGIPAEQLPSLFQPFSRGTAPGRSISGTGLGLYISNRIVQRLGGRMSVESEVGAGTTVTVRLPRVPVSEF